MLNSTLARAGLPLALLLLASRPAGAIPLFAHQYGVTCEKCHTVIPHLNEFGAAFQAFGDRIPGVQPGPAVPVAGKLNLVGSSLNQGSGPNGAGLPKAIVDEVELFTSGALGTRGTYFVEQYVLDGGMPGLTRDAWIADRIDPWAARIPVQVAAGSFTLPLPVDPETFRDAAQHYAIDDQAVGSNPFRLFDPKIGGRIAVGNPLAGASVQFFAGPGHDRQSGLPSTGTDVMAYLQDAMGPFVAGVYSYHGIRPTGTGFDRFTRTGYALAYDQWGRFSVENVLQTGWDSDCGIGPAIGCASSGGFTQTRWQFSRRLYAGARYEGTTDPIAGLARDAVLLLGYGPRENVRITLEDVIAHTPGTTHTMNLQYTVAY